jgi:hypothetical protein
MSLYAYGTQYNAFVLEGTRLVIYCVQPQRGVYDTTYKSSITSVITVEDRVFFSLSDGSILQFPRFSNKE